jgi:hypothetical protein
MDWLPTALHDDHGDRLTFIGGVPSKGVIHTTEGAGWPTYSGWTIEPQSTVMPLPGKGISIRQHIPFGFAGMSLVHLSGQPETNRADAYQFEFIGTCDPSQRGKGMYYWPEADDAVLRAVLGEIVLPMAAAGIVPAVSSVSWAAYPGSYGASKVRLSASAWTRYHGWCGHQHVPENVHGDPGAFPWGRMMALVGGNEVELGTVVTFPNGATTTVGRILEVTYLALSGPILGTLLNDEDADTARDAMETATLQSISTRLDALTVLVEGLTGNPPVAGA